MAEEKWRKYKFFPIVGIVAFVVFSFLFSIGRNPLSILNSRVLALTGEITVRKRARNVFLQDDTSGKGGGKGAKGKGKRKAPARRARPSQPKVDYSNPVVANFPKTQPLVAPLLSFAPERGDRRLRSTPPLRLHSGEKWDQEETDIKLGVHDGNLHVFCDFRDKNAKDLIMGNALKNPGEAYRDDSLELMLMKDRNAKHYCQYMVSASGKHSLNYMNVNDPKIPVGFNKGKAPAGFKNPKVKVRRDDGGFTIDMIIDLDNIGIRDVSGGDQFLIRLIRNYRGQGHPKSKILQLFPTAIYADKRRGGSNHDRRAFQPLTVK